jgi:RNA polymerase sigma factor (sigma-70 family)
MPVITRTSTMLLEGLKNPASKEHWQEFDSRYRPLLLAVARRLGLNPVDAEDAAQETLTAFLQAYRLDRYNRESGRLRDWLAGIMNHKVRDAQRKSHRQQKLIRDAAASEVVMDEIADPSVQTAMEQEWSRALLRECLEEVRREVTPQTFESFELYALQQWPAGQVAKRLGISLDVVYQNKRRVLVRVRQLLPKMEQTW